MNRQAQTGISAITIENFKAVRSKCRIEFRPITLLFGPNSAGKSTILQALQFMREILERRNVNPDKTMDGGENMDLGGFANLVHRHDISRPITIRIDRFGAGSSGYGPEGEFSEEHPPERMYLDTSCLVPFETVYVQITVEAGANGIPVASKYEVGVNGQRFAEISLNPSGRPVISYLNVRSILVPAGKPHVSDWDMLEQLHKKVSAALVGGDSKALLLKNGDWQGTAIPTWQERLHIPVVSSVVPEDNDSPCLDVISGLLSQIIVGAGEVVLNDLQRLRYLGPIREVPSRTFQHQTSLNASRWASGLAAWDLLYSRYDRAARTGDEFFKSISRVMCDGDGLDLGYSMDLAEVYEIRDDSAIMNHVRMLGTESEKDQGERCRARLVRELERLQPKQRLILHDVVNDTDVKQQDIGVGISQVLPVVVGAMEPKCSIFAVEQPELHIHPRIQCNLGDVFAREVNKDDGRVFLIETHSEHLILRLLRRIRETTENELPPGRPTLRPDQVAVYYVEGGADGMKATEIPIAPDGDFTKQWPKGFFEERAGELF
jgi:hypothetical protein